MNIAFIPVRGGSKSIPNKNIKFFCGKPLVYWSLSALQNSKNIDQIIVATDSQEIASIVSSFSFSKVAVYDRDIQNARDTASTESVMLEYLEKNSLQEDDLFILVQATSPFTQSYHLDEALCQYKKEKADSLLTCVRLKRFYWSDNGVPINYDFTNRPRRQDFAGLLTENGAFYISRVDKIKQYKNRLNGKISIYEMDDYAATEIDEEDDWVIAEQLMYKHVLKNELHNKNIKLFLCDVDGTLTDAGMYYDQNGNELKKFNTHDGKGFEFLRKENIKTGIITSENTNIVKRRAEKLKVDFLFQGIEHKGKLDIAIEICKEEGITLSEVAYIGDDVNCKELLSNVGIAACPENAVDEIKDIPNIIKLKKKGGDGAVREFINIIIPS